MTRMTTMIMALMLLIVPIPMWYYSKSIFEKYRNKRRDMGNDNIGESEIDWRKYDRDVC